MFGALASVTRVCSDVVDVMGHANELFPDPEIFSTPEFGLSGVQVGQLTSRQPPSPHGRNAWLSSESDPLR